MNFRPATNGEKLDITLATVALIVSVLALIKSYL